MQFCKVVLLLEALRLATRYDAAMQEGKRPVILDLFCGAGGGAKGYHEAGFMPLGVDTVYSPYYPFKHVRGNATSLPVLTSLITKYRPVAIHASPPCHRYSKASGTDDHPDLVAPVRDLLMHIGLPWIIENVPGAPLGPPWSPYGVVELCGTQFPELRVIRHRLFESNIPLYPVGVCLPTVDHPPVYTTKPNHSQYGKLDPDTAYLQVTGHGNCTQEQAARAMGIDWYMTKHDLNQAIPPAYTRFLGKQLLHFVLNGVAEPDNAPVHPLAYVLQGGTNE